MTREQLCSKIQEALDAFQFKGEYKSHKPYGTGHINDTFRVICTENGKDIKYILQRINHEVFHDVPQLMENIVGTTEFLGETIIQEGGDRSREALKVIPTKAGDHFFQDSIGSYWRVYDFITDSFALDLVENPEDFYESAVAFGRFQALLSNYPAETLHETIPNFHNTPSRFQNFLKAVEEDKLGRKKDVEQEIQFVLSREDFMDTLTSLQQAGELPLRVTHNDTKLNNVLFDQKTRKGVCVIDLDTVMPGLSVNDFGDSIRFGASTAEEDEQDLSKVELDLHLFEEFTKGFLLGAGDVFTKTELDNMVVGAKMMTLECGMRFLTDHLVGDEYFRIHRENHNLDRTRTQFKLVEEMEAKWEKMQNIVKNATI